MHGGNLRWAKERFGREEFVDLSANINPFGPPSGVLARLQQILPQIVHYPDPESKVLRIRLSQVYSIPLDYIIVGNGAGELIFTILQAFKPKRVVIPLPAFSEYERAAKAVEAEIAYLVLGADGWDSLLPLNSISDFETFRETWLKILRGTDLLFLCSPHNPTGTVLRREHFANILDIARKVQCRVLFDESFNDFLPDALRWTAREFLEDYPNLTVLYSLTKFFSLPGLRLGAGFAHPEDISRLMAFRDPWSVNTMAQEAGLAALEEPSYPAEVRVKLTESRFFFYQEFSRKGFTKWKLCPTVVNFALLHLLEGTSGGLVADLGKRGILVRDCASFTGLKGEFIRFAIKDIASMQGLLDAMEDIEKEKS
ncbi:MAG: pyridoxal phosphate-dependent aminotransferase [Desulfitobacteriaceae bacterium]